MWVTQIYHILIQAKEFEFFSVSFHLVWMSPEFGNWYEWHTSCKLLKYFWKLCYLHVDAIAFHACCVKKKRDLSLAQVNKYLFNKTNTVLKYIRRSSIYLCRSKRATEHMDKHITKYICVSFCSSLRCIYNIRRVCIVERCYKN